MGLVQQECNFCSDCKWAKVIEMGGTLKIYCQKKKVTSGSAFTFNYSPIRRLSAYACGHFDKKVK